MYKQRQGSNSHREFSRPSGGRFNRFSGSRTGSSGRSFGARVGGYGGQRGGGRGGPRGGGRGQYIDVSKFISKPVPHSHKSTVAVVYVPTHKFADFKIDEHLKKNIIAKGYVTPTAIQDKSIPVLLTGSDIVGIANTGTGKTAAFLIPLINKVLANRKENILILAPTRELAIQIHDELKAFTSGMRIHSMCAVGGAPIGKQIADLRHQNNFVIGTPGRVKDLIERKHIPIAKFGTAVLDEADRMLDMGFIADMRRIMSWMSPVRHTLFFSATLSPEIEKLIKDFLKDPVRISVKTSDTAVNVHQDIVRITPGKNKFTVLHDLLGKPEFKKVLVFGRTKHGVEKISTELAKRGVKADSIHGNKNHSRRQRSLGAFKNNELQVLVATDVAARGLDISDVSHVINFDIPATYEDYVHRIGRTGRGDKKGKALTFVE